MEQTTKDRTIAEQKKTINLLKGEIKNLVEKNKALENAINQQTRSMMNLLLNESNQDIIKWEQRRWELFISDTPHLRDIHHHGVQNRLDDIDILINNYRKYPMKLDENNF